jgi:hypothetical protein
MKPVDVEVMRFMKDAGNEVRINGNKEYSHFLIKALPHRRYDIQIPAKGT